MATLTSCHSTPTEFSATHLLPQQAVAFLSDFRVLHSSSNVAVAITVAVRCNSLSLSLI